MNICNLTDLAELVCGDEPLTIPTDKQKEEYTKWKEENYQEQVLNN